MRTSFREVVTPLLAAVLSIVSAGSVAAQDIQVQAFSGTPFGVGKMTVQFESAPSLPLDAPLWLSEASGRALYPAVERTAMRVPTTKNAFGPTSLSAYFLFRGETPLRLTLQTDRDHTATAQPEEDETAHKALLDAWWIRYTAAARNVAASGAYQPLMENYLMNTLSRRLGLDAPRLPLAWSGWASVDQALAVMTGAESVRIAAQTDVLLEDADKAEPADQEVPSTVNTPPIRLPKTEDRVDIEPIAYHVPEECFYIRCGSFANFTWLRSIVNEWGGKMRHIAAVRGLDYGVSQRIERQLALRETMLARMLGDTVISDVAIVGTDTFLREGAAVGVLFQVRSDSAIRLQISQQRQETLAANPRATEETVLLDDREVSLLSTPDNVIRSFWAVDGKYHFVTTSRTLAKRFFEAGEGQRSLGGAEEFRWARSIKPLADDHTVFVYLSDPFFRKLVSPQYRIEMTRRTRAACEGDVVQLARLAARAEGTTAGTIAQLADLDLLPKSFGSRPDGSRVVADGDRLYDSLRGAYGSFLPVPDVEITKVTRSEALAYRRFAEVYQRQWRRMDPTILGIKRRVLEDGQTERLTFDIHITPYAREHYQTLAVWLGETDQQRWASVPGDIASVDVNMQGRKYTLGVRDCTPYFAVRDGTVVYSGPRDDQIPLYVAADVPNKPNAPPAHFLATLFWKYKKADEAGDMRVDNPMFGEAWMRRRPGVDMVAFDRDLLDRITPYMKLVPAERNAKVRLRVEDLSNTRFAAAIHAEGYIRARKVSAGNTYFLHALMQQLHVPGNQAREVAEQLLHGKLVCPLGGRYRLESGFTSVERWQSSAWAGTSLYQENHVPKDFHMPLLDWLAGISLEMDIDNTTLSTYIKLDVHPAKQ